MDDDKVRVYPRKGVTIHLPGGTAGFTAGMGVPLHRDLAQSHHARGLVMTADEKRAADAEAAAAKS